MKTTQVWGVLAGLVPALLLSQPANAQEAVDNVVIVLDASGSMARPIASNSTQDKMSAAKAALKEVLKTVPQETHIGLLVFSAKGATTDWFYPLGPRDDDKLTQAIDTAMPGGDTPLGKYIKKGADRLLEQRSKQFGYGTFRLLVVTDGEASDQQLMERYTPEVVARGITVDAIGVAMNQRHTLATKVHSYRSANDPASLKRAVAEVFGEIGGSRGKDVATADAFSELNAIPTEVAQAMIQALSSSGNQPIGERPKPAQAQTTTTPAATPSPAAPTAQPIVMTGTPQSKSPSIKINIGSAILSSIGGLACIGLVILGLIILGIRTVKKR